ncbi:hypothetical protein HYU10_02080 [Candidatus Woesearchaeota archaeon]|nr:hypothetical protein [Candidatus Woesearchaeota archaeon]MBI2661359.1 hypothetical protein [Candidatus Woesearchaeota archaeon]
MTDLVACMTDEKGSKHVQSLVNNYEWGSVFLITNADNGLSFNKKIEYVRIDFDRPVSQVIEDIKKCLNGKINDFEVALNLVSGSGKEHMAILAALLKLGVGVRLMAVTKEGVREL